MRSSDAVLRQTMADVFGLSVEEIPADASIDNIEAWDSLKHLNLVLALEEQFGVTFSEEETVEILSYEIIRSVLAEHGVELES